MKHPLVKPDDDESKFIDALATWQRVSGLGIDGADRLARYIVDTLTDPRNTRVLSLTIGLRIFFFRTWRLLKSFSPLEYLKIAFRPIFLALTAVGFPLGLFVLASYLLPDGLNYSIGVVKKSLQAGVSSDGAALSWREIVQLFVLFIGLPVAYIVWIFRDSNARIEINLKKKEISLKEFQDIQLRVAGAIDKSFPESSRYQLQAAALHQIEGFIKGDFGADFRKSAFELLTASPSGISDSIERDPLEFEKTFPNPVYSSISSWCNDFKKRKNKDLHFVARIRSSVISQSLEACHRSGVELAGRNFSFIIIPDRSLLAKSNFSSSELSVCTARYGHFEKCDFSSAWAFSLTLYDCSIEASNFSGFRGIFCSFDASRFQISSFRSSKFVVSSFRGSDLRAADCRGASLRLCDFESSDLSFCNFYQSNIYGSRFNLCTVVSVNFFGADLQRCYFNKAKIRSCRFQRADLSKANFADASIENCSFVNSNLSGAIIYLEDVKGCDFSGAFIDKSTVLSRDWNSLKSSEKDRIISECKKNGMLVAV